MRYILSFIIAISIVLTPVCLPLGMAFAGEEKIGTAPERGLSHFFILYSKDYFQTVQETIQQAEESIYVAMYLINVEAEVNPENPASSLIEELINAKKRGVYVKVILDDTKFSVNYNAYKRLKEGGIDVYLDSPQAVLHGKGIVIDSKICILGSFNWSRASLYDNYEFATYIESEEEAKKLLDYLNSIKLALKVPILPEKVEGVKLKVSLLMSPSKPSLSRLFTSHAERSFDLYLYLLKKAQKDDSNTIRIVYKELAQALGYKDNYYFSVRQPMNNLKHKYGLIKHTPWSKYLVIARRPKADEAISISIPYAYWRYGFNKKLSFRAKYMYLVCLQEAQNSARNPYWFRSNADLARMYHIGERSVSQGIKDLETENILEVYRSKPKEFGNFKDRPANAYRLNPLISQQAFNKALKTLTQKYGSDLTQKAQQLSAQLNESKDIEKIEIFIALIKQYGYERVREVNSEVASKRRETGFRNLSQTILLLKQ